MTRESKPGMGELIDFPQNPEEPKTETVLPRLGECLQQLRALASLLDVDQRKPGWTSDVVRTVARLQNEQLRTERAHRETLRTIAAATRGKRLEDVPSCFDAAPARVVAEVLRMHEEIRVKDGLVASVGQVNDDLNRELEATRIELAKRQG